LRENEVRLRLAQRAVRLGTFDWRVGVSPPTVSEEFAEIHGLPPGTREDPLENWVRRIHPDDRLRTAAAVEAMLRGDTYDIEYRIIRQNDGATRWIASRAEVFADEGTTTGSPSEGFRVIGAIRDVTERRQTENALRQLNEDLERRVSEEVAARQDAQIKLAQAQRMEALGQLAGGIAHDFNNILQSIQGAATLIERRPDDPVRVQSLARMALDATARGASVTLRLLAFSRQSELRAEAVDPAALLNSLAEMFAHTLGATIAVTVNVPPGVPNLLADRAQLETVIVNLATNGRDAMERGGTLTLAADHVVLGPQDKRVSAGRLPAGDYVRLRVTDTGTGMDAATLARASEPFFTTKPLNRGTGLGLAMARGFVEQSGGLLTIESVLGRGTEVSILFAATAPAAEPAAAERSPLRRTASGGQHILVIDDEDGIRETLAPQLEADGYKVATLHNGTLALDHVASGASVDLVVCDLSMPGANGIEVIHAIQTLRPGLPAILLTGFAGDDVMPPSAKGPDPSFTLLRKPIAGQALSDRIAAMLADRGR
jgi:signal transduction histidine kinase